MAKSKLEQIKRIIFDITLFIFNILLIGYLSPSPEETQTQSLFSMQFICYKALLVNGGFIHAHITRKLAFPTVDWMNDENKMLKLLIMVIYASFVFAWSRGG